MKAKIASFTYRGANKGLLILELDGDFRDTYDKLNKFDVDVTVKKWHPARSKDANALLWEMCTRIAKEIGSTKEEVYRRNIREVGEYTPLPIKVEAVFDFERIWSAHGIGWFIDVVDDSKIPGYKLVFAYQGSSTYDTKQMSRLIDNVMQDAKAIGIETEDPNKIKSLLEEWK